MLSVCFEGTLRSCHAHEWRRPSELVVDERVVGRLSARQDAAQTASSASFSASDTSRASGPLSAVSLIRAKSSNNSRLRARISVIR